MQPMLKGLLVIDMQRGFSPPPTMVAAIQARYRDFDKVVLTRFFNKDGSFFQTMLGYYEMTPNTFQSELVVTVPHHGEVHDHYGTYGISAESVAYLRDLDMAWTVVGTDTDAGLAAVCFQLWDAGISFEIDGMMTASSGGPSQKEAGFKVLTRQFAKRVA